MLGNRNKNAVLISIYCQRQKMRLNTSPNVVLRNSSINNMSGSRIQTEQGRRLKTIRDQKFKLQYRSESREPFKSQALLSDQRKLSHYEPNSSDADNEDKALMIHKIIFSIKSPPQSLRYQGSVVEKKPLITRRRIVRNSMMTNPYNDYNGWSRKSSESLIFC